MKTALKVTVFAVAFAAIGQSIYKAHADQSERDFLGSMSAEEQVEVLLLEKASFEESGLDFPQAKRRALSRALKDLLDQVDAKDSVLAIKEKPGI